MRSTWWFAARRQLVRARREWRSAQQQAAAENAATAEGSTTEHVGGILQFGALVAFAHNYVLSSTQCIGPSMLPTIGTSGDVVLIWPTAGGLVQPQLGDVVLCASPTDPTSTVCKRVLGMPGDVMRYRWLPGMPPARDVIVPRGHCWLQGDNQSDSTDSRYYGTVPLALVKGVVFSKVWPLREAKWISRIPPRPEEQRQEGLPLRSGEPASVPATRDAGPPARHSDGVAPHPPGDASTTPIEGMPDGGVRREPSAPPLAGKGTDAARPLGVDMQTHSPPSPPAEANRERHAEPPAAGAAHVQPLPEPEPVAAAPGVALGAPPARASPQQARPMHDADQEAAAVSAWRERLLRDREPRPGGL